MNRSVQQPRWAPVVRGMAAVAAVALAAVLATELGNVGTGIVVAMVAGSAVGWWAHRRHQVESSRIAGQVAAWPDGGPRSIALTDLDNLLDLAVELDVAGGRIDRHIAGLEADLPWRRQLVAALPSAVVLFGGDGYLLAANDDARSLLGIPSDGERTTVVAALGNAQLAEATRHVHGNSGVVVVDTEVSGRVIRAHITAVGDQRLVLIADRTRERQVEDLRRNFVVNASHELKTPATAIQALADALVVTARTDPGRMPALVQRLEGESQRLIRLVHDLLDLRRLEDSTEATRTTVDVVEIMEQVVEDLAGRAAARDVEVTCDMPAQAIVASDPEDVGLVLRNLVSNALQYNRDGGSVQVRITRADPVVIEVADTGIGIPKADLDRIFERFYRVDVARSRATGGTGLGLSMVRHALSRNGGSIEVDSLLGTGTTFRVSLPPGPDVSGAPHPPRDAAARQELR